MYEYISGRVAEIAPTYAVVEAAGIGYYINISLQTYSAIENQESALLYLHFAVREDAHIFYGFATKMERELFRQLISVSGVGGNTARMILSVRPRAQVAERKQVLNGIAALKDGVKKVKPTPVKKEEKVGPNDPCPCGSGKKYKKCCGGLTTASDDK